MSNWLKPDGIEVAAIRSKYPVGTRIILDQMGPDPMPVEPGTKGTVTHVDDIGTVHCTFENGRVLGLIAGEDQFHICCKAGEIDPKWKRTCLCLDSMDFHTMLKTIYPDVKGIVVHYDLDGLWVSSEADDDWGPDEEELCGRIGQYLGIDVTSIHIDDFNETGIWIVYQGVSE